MTNQENMNDSVVRISIYKYHKSGKLSAVKRCSETGNYVALDISPDMDQIIRLRFLKRFNYGLVSYTKFSLEVEETINKVDNEQYRHSYRFIRILSEKDVDVQRWKSTSNLADLPVGMHTNVFREELAWAGERPGNSEEGWLYLMPVICFVWCIGMAWGSYLWVGIWSLCAIFSIYNLSQFQWKFARKASAEKLLELNKYKEKLRANHKNSRHDAKTELLDALKLFSAWVALTPEQFEHAVKHRLEDLGFRLDTTNYSGDGGIDLEGFNDKDEEIIVQAKQYKSNVGVAVVREMIGVRQTQANRPRVMIVSLVGFTRGAKELARQEGISLMTVRDDLLGV